jgi:hypothetical protein
MISHLSFHQPQISSSTLLPILWDRDDNQGRDQKYKRKSS